MKQTPANHQIKTDLKL